ncbi:MAG TPA: MAPEG family protein [Rhizomicrobium sp.]|nr:MAPEG family protein [Rhizomicrobium sp.]
MLIHLPESVIALVFYALWAIALVLMIAADRFLLILRGQVKNNEFLAGVPHGNDSYWRINRAHLNTVENLPIFAAVVLAGWVAGAESHTFNLLAVLVLVFRIVQSIVHIFSGNQMATWFRTAAFAVQLVCEIWMAAMILQSAGVI